MRNYTPLSGFRKVGTIVATGLAAICSYSFDVLGDPVANVERKAAQESKIENLGIDGAEVGGNFYYGAKLPKDLVVKINEIEVKRNTMLETYLMPRSGSKRNFIDGKLRDVSNNEKYMLVNIVSKDGKLEVNSTDKLGKTSITIAEKKVAAGTKLDDIAYSTEQIVIGEKNFMVVNMKKKKDNVPGYESLFENALSKTTVLPIVFIDTPSKPFVEVIEDKDGTTVRVSVNGFQYLAVKGELVKPITEKPKVPEVPEKAAVTQAEATDSGEAVSGVTEQQEKTLTPAVEQSNTEKDTTEKKSFFRKKTIDKK